MHAESYDLGLIMVVRRIFEVGTLLFLLEFWASFGGLNSKEKLYAKTMHPLSNPVIILYFKVIKKWQIAV